MPPFSILWSVLFAVRQARLRPGGMDTQNWKAMFADRESDDENKWIITSAFSDYDEPRDRLYALEAPVRTVSLPPGSGYRKPGLTTSTGASKRSGGAGVKKEPPLLRVGVLGCGPISQFAHIEACRKARNAELYAICDVAEDLVERMAAIHAPQVTYTNYEAMLSDPIVEAVIVAVADQFHVPAAREAIEAGKHVLVEKPMGVDVEECEDLRESVLASGLVLQVGTEKR